MDLGCLCENLRPLPVPQLGVYMTSFGDVDSFEVMGFLSLSFYVLGFSVS